MREKYISRKETWGGIQQLNGKCSSWTGGRHVFWSSVLIIKIKLQYLTKFTNERGEAKKNPDAEHVEDC